MYDVIKTVITEGNFVLGDLLSKIDYFFAKGSLTESECAELKEKARSSAEPSKEADLFAKLMELEARVKKLEEGGVSNEGESTVEDFVVGKWYYNGNKCLWNGKVYTCIAPEGTVCVWSPTDYPAYWDAE
jgi:hypothetical protein